MCCDYSIPEGWHKADTKHKRKGLSSLGITWLTFARVSVQPHVNMHFFQAKISQASVLIFSFE